MAQGVANAPAIDPEPRLGEYEVGTRLDRLAPIDVGVDNHGAGQRLGGHAVREATKAASSSSASRKLEVC